MTGAFTIGIAGHVDHGKTTLVKCLTGIDTDRRAEEKARGLSIESGVAQLPLPAGGWAALIDVPGHTDFLKNTIRGLNGVDMAVLVVAADDGVMPQTREHLEILSFFKAAAGLVVLTKTDLVDEETLELAQLEVEELLKGTFLENAPILKFTSTAPDCGARIAASIEKALAGLPAKQSNASFRLWIDQIRSIPGHGTVVSGTMASGKLRCNDDIILLPAGIKTRARSLETHGCAATHAVAGQRVGINLHRVPVNQVSRGMSLAAPGTVEPTYLLNASVRVLPNAPKGIKNRQRIKIYLGTCATSAMIVLLNNDRLAAGDSGLIQIRLMNPMAALPRDAFVISPLNLNTVIAGGRVLEIPREKFRAVKSGAVLPYLTALHDADANACVESLMGSARGSLIAANQLSAKTGLPQTAFESAINSRVQKGELVYIKGHGAIKESHLGRLRKQFMAVIAEAFAKDPLKKTVGLPEIARHLDYRVEEVLLRITADGLCKDGEIVSLNGGYRPAGTQAGLDAHNESQVAFILQFVQAAGLTPISPNFFWKRHQDRYGQAKVSRLFKYLYAQKKLIRLKDNRYLSIEALEEIKKRVVRAVADQGFITLGDCKQLLGYGRSGGAFVLDYLNEIGFTTRREDKHYLNKNGA